MRNLLRRAVEVGVYAGALGIGYRLLTRFMAELGRSRLISDVSKGRPDPWAFDERHESRDPSTPR